MESQKTNGVARRLRIITWKFNKKLTDSRDKRGKRHELAFVVVLFLTSILRTDKLLKMSVILGRYRTAGCSWQMIWALRSRSAYRTRSSRG